MEDDLKDKINMALAEIRPILAWHKGDVEFVRFEDGVVYVKMLGMCRGCPLSQITLKSGIEKILKSRVREINSVEAVE